MTLKINIGEIWLANLNPTRGTEAGKTRPVLILQSQLLLDALHPSTLVLPLTTHLTQDGYPLRVRVVAEGKLKKTSDILIDQIRAVDNKRLTQGPLTCLSEEQLNEVYAAVSEIMGMNPYKPKKRRAH